MSYLFLSQSYQFSKSLGFPDTFVRSSVQQWLDSGYRSCRITKLLPPERPSLTPIHALRSLISIYTLYPFHRRSPFHLLLRCQLTESGAMSAVLSESALQEKALSLLLNLSLEDDNKVGLVAEWAIGRVLAVLQVGSPDNLAIGCTILTSLAVVEVNKATMGE